MKTSSIDCIQNIQYGISDGVPLLLDMYHPRERNDQPFKVIVFIHGGGWYEGDKAGYGGTTWAPFFAEHGYVSVSINYRLSTTAVFPAQLTDCQLAVRWLRANGEHYHLATEHIAAWGHSAGGHLALLLVTVGDKVTDRVHSDLDGYSCRVQVAASVAGPTDLLAMGEWHDGPESPEARLIGGSVQTRRDVAQAASPSTYVNDETPPILLIHGEQDEIVPVDQSERMYHALRRGSIFRIKDMDHGLNSHEVPEHDLLHLILKFFDKHLHTERQ